jgi:hypothetical protein
MAGKHSISLGDLEGQIDPLNGRMIDALEVKCSKCDRAGRIPLVKLFAEHGRAAFLPPLRHTLAGDCPKLKSQSPYDQCDVFFPQLPRVFKVPQP